MCEILPFKRPNDHTPEVRRDPNRQYGEGEAFCLNCQHTWTAIVETGTTQLECPECHTKHDRDTNASINILDKGLQMQSA